MKLENISAGIVDWSSLPCARESGQTGHAEIRTVQQGEARLRLVDYSPGYRSDHWCSKGHIVMVMIGTMMLEHKDGRNYALLPGMTYHVGDNIGAPHRVSSDEGCRAFVAD